MNTNLSFISLVLEASFVVQLVMLLLLVVSIASWAVIIEKRRLLKQATGVADAFETSFWSGGDLTTIYKSLAEGNQGDLGMTGIFGSGFREFARLEKESLGADQVLEGARRSMRVSQMREMDRLEHNLAFLATVGSTSPYVGLFGTVWGIMNSFQSIAISRNTSLAIVAPGIAEALFATALGLLAAIPAVVAFNKFTSDSKKYSQKLENFSKRFLSII